MKDLDRLQVALLRALQAAGGVADLGRKLGISRQAVDQWKDYGYIPENRLTDVEQATGINRAELRPDIAEYWLKNGTD